MPSKGIIAFTGVGLERVTNLLLRQVRRNDGERNFFSL